MRSLALLAALALTTALAYAQNGRVPTGSIELIPGQVYATHAEGKTTADCACDNVYTKSLTLAGDFGVYTYAWSNGIKVYEGTTTYAGLMYLGGIGKLILGTSSSSYYGTLTADGLTSNVVDNMIEDGDIAVHNTNRSFTVSYGSNSDVYGADQLALFHSGIMQGGISQPSDGAGVVFSTKGGSGSYYTTTRSENTNRNLQQWWPNDSGAYQINHNNVNTQTISLSTSITIYYDPPIHFIPTNIMISPKSPTAGGFWNAGGGYVGYIGPDFFIIHSSIVTTGTCTFGYEPLK